MTHRLASACAALLVTALAAACSSGPPDERTGEQTGTASQALSPPRCTTAFGTVTCTADDRPLCWCESLAGPPAPGPYPPGAMTSCPGGALPTPGVPPPSALSGCTYGMAIGSPVAEYRVFLCPTNMTLPPSGGKCPDWTIYAWLGGPVDNGCFGDPVDPSYAYVYAYNPCDSPGNCGAQCASGAPRP